MQVTEGELSWPDRWGNEAQEPVLNWPAHPLVPEARALGLGRGGGEEGMGCTQGVPVQVLQ